MIELWHLGQGILMRWWQLSGKGRRTNLFHRVDIWMSGKHGNWFKIQGCFCVQAGLPPHELDSARCQCHLPGFDSNIFDYWVVHGRRTTDRVGPFEISAPETHPDFFAPTTQPQLQTMLLEQPPTVMGSLQLTQPQLYNEMLDGGWLPAFRTQELPPPQPELQSQRSDPQSHYLDWSRWYMFKQVLFYDVLWFFFMTFHVLG